MRQAMLINDAAPVEMSAVIEGEHRYSLRRLWDRTLPVLTVCMLNPSTADGKKDDPTMHRVIAFAKRWGYGGVVVVNLFALISTDPRALYVHPDPVGSKNDRWIEQAVLEGSNTLVAWGNDGALKRRDEAVLDIIRTHRRPICLHWTGSQMPKHPLARGKHRVPDDFQPIVYPWK